MTNLIDTEQEIEITQPPKSASRTAILVLTIIGAFFSFTVGGCTSVMSQGLAKTGDNLNKMSEDFDRRFSKYGSQSQNRSERVDTEKVRSSGANAVLMGFLEAVLGAVGGVIAYNNFGTTTRLGIGPYPLRKIRFAGLLILLAAIFSIGNLFAFITAGIMNGIAAALCLLNKPETAS